MIALMKLGDWVDHTSYELISSEIRAVNQTANPRLIARAEHFSVAYHGSGPPSQNAHTGHTIYWISDSDLIKLVFPFLLSHHFSTDVC